MSLPENTVAINQSTALTPKNSGILASLGINGQLFVFQLINFALVAGVIWFLILKPLTKKMAERQKLIDDSLDNAKKVQDNLFKSEKEYQSRIDTAKAEANSILEKASRQSEIESEAARNQARLEIEKLVEQARKKIHSEKAALSVELRKETADLIIAALTKIIGDKVDADEDKKIIADALRRLD